ncbi:MAG: serine acetyltransferase [Deltaproteobacteria bacterium]|nr:serine acetyltransferase [Deltaproteobacteria bacterium]
MTTKSSGLRDTVDALLLSYRTDGRAQHVNRRFLPSREEIVSILDVFFELLFPGYFGKLDITDENLAYHVGNLVATLREKLDRQIECCLCYRDETNAHVDEPRCRAHGRELTRELLTRLPELRRRLVLDAQAALDGDPAAGSLDEIILSYPGYRAITVHRIAHELFLLGVPLMPRIMSEWAHTETGADIHPGATIGERFFIDHATGVVIGATTHIGARVRIYQGVTLGALSLKRDQSGRVVGAAKRHPTVEDDVTIYAGATVLGGDTVIGKGSVIGGAVFITSSIVPGSRVALDPPKLRIGAPRELEQPADDFDI